jgi:hypothetical protein
MDEGAVLSGKIISQFSSRPKEIGYHLLNVVGLLVNSDVKSPIFNFVLLNSCLTTVKKV